MNSAANANPLAYADARAHVRNGDLLLWRPTSLVGRFICWVTGSVYSHAAMAGWWGDCLCSLEMRSWSGGVAGMLSQQILQSPGKCDVFRVRGISGQKSVQVMVRRTNSPYGWINFLHVGWRKLFPWAVWEHVHTGKHGADVVCSSAVAYACEIGGRSACRPGQTFYDLAPGDLAFPFSEYKFTLV